MLRLRKLATDYDPHDRISALTYLQQRHAAGEVVTGLLFVEADHGDLHEFLDTVERRSTRWTRPSCARRSTRSTATTPRIVRPCEA